MWKHLLAPAILILALATGFNGPAAAQSELTPRPSPTYKACHICDEEAADNATAMVSAPVVPVATLAPDELTLLPTQSTPVVRAMMFWMDSCPHCHEVLEQVLPPLQGQYGAQLQIHLLELTTPEIIEQFYQVADFFGIPRAQAGVPLLVIGDRALLGEDQIAAELPGLTKQHLAAGGVDWPTVAGLARWAPAATHSEICAPETPCAEETAVVAAAPTPPAVTGSTPVADSTQAGMPAGAHGTTSNGFTLALVIMAGMAAALVYTGVVVVRGSSGGPVDPPATWQRWLVPLLALAGLGVAGYLAYVETLSVRAVCGPVGDCNTVQASPYARLFGVLPVGVLGALGYLAILAAWWYGQARSNQLARYAVVAVFGMALFGVLFSLYLTYLEPFVIRAVCAWCLTSAVIMTLLLLLSIRPALAALTGDVGKDVLCVTSSKSRV